MISDTWTPAFDDSAMIGPASSRASPAGRRVTSGASREREERGQHQEDEQDGELLGVAESAVGGALVVHAGGQFTAEMEGEPGRRPPGELRADGIDQLGAAATEPPRADDHQRLARLAVARDTLIAHQIDFLRLPGGFEACHGRLIGGRERAADRADEQ